MGRPILKIYDLQIILSSYFSDTTLEEVREAWRRAEEDQLPPVLVTRIDEELSLIDGHSRALVAYEQGQAQVKAEVLPLGAIEGSRALYEHIHRDGPRQGVRTIADLEDRILDPEEHKRIWVGYCSRWIEENEPVSEAYVPGK